jgi:hypothetical protein
MRAMLLDASGRQQDQRVALELAGDLRLRQIGKDAGGKNFMRPSSVWRAPRP